MGQIYKSPEINSLKHPVLVLFFPFSFDPVFLLAFSPPVSFSLDFLSSGVPPRESDSELDSLIFNPFCGTISDWIAIQMVIFRHTARELKGGKAMRTHGLGEVELNTVLDHLRTIGCTKSGNSELALQCTNSFLRRVGEQLYGAKEVW